MRMKLLLIAVLACIALVVAGSNSRRSSAQTPDKQIPVKPTPDKPTPDKPTPDKPTPDKPTPDKPTSDKPTSDKPTSDKPTSDKESKTQPKEVALGKDSQSDKYGECPFNHENHSTKPYNPDGKSVLTCVECHHTDQPAADLKPPLKTSERTVLLTTASLAAADAKPVKTCRACHLQAGDDSAPMPTVTYPDKPAPTKLTNEISNHNNCNVCHDKAIAARPALKGKIPGSTDCLPCHKPVT